MTEAPENNNPYNKSQRSGHPHTIKWCAWEILLTEGLATEDRIAEIIVERGLRDEIKATSIAKELGGDKNRFVSSPEGWSIIPPIDDEPVGPSRRHLPSAAAPTQAPKSPAKRKEPPEMVPEEPTSGRRRTKSASEWWKVNTEDEQHGDGGGDVAVNNNEDEDEEIDIMTGTITPAKSRGMFLKETTTNTQEQIQLEKKENDGEDGSAAAEQPAVAAAVVAEVEEKPAKGNDEPPPPPPPPVPAAAPTLDVEQPKPTIDASTAPQDDVTMNLQKVSENLSPEKLPEAPAPVEEDNKASNDSIIKPEAATAAPVESTKPVAVAPPPVQKGFVIPKRRSSVEASTAPVVGGGAGSAPGAPSGSKDASYHRTTTNNRTNTGNIRELGSSGGSGSLRRPPSSSNIAAEGPAGAAGRPPLPPKKQQPWEHMLQDMKGAFATAWKRLEWPSTATSLPRAADPNTVTEEQRAAWEQARTNFGAAPPPLQQAQQPPESVTAPAPTTAAADGTTPSDQDDMVLQQLKQDPYPLLPPEFNYLRIMQCTNSREQQSLDRNVFVSNHRADTEGIEPGRTLIVLYNFDKQVVHGCYRAVEVGNNLDNTFQREWCHHVRVEPILPLCSPLPSYLLEGYLPRKVDKNGELMKFFEKGTPAKCTSEEVLRSTYDQFALPYNPNQINLFFQGDIWCPQQDIGSNAGTGPRRGVLLTLGELDVFIDCNGAFILNGGILGQIIFPLTLKSGLNTQLQFSLNIDKFNSVRPVSLCVNGGGEETSLLQPPGLVKYITAQESLLLSNGISIGPRSTIVPAIRASISNLILQADMSGIDSSSTEGVAPLPTGVLTPSLSSFCTSESDLTSIKLSLDKFTAENTLPEVTILQATIAAGGSRSVDVVEVEEEIELMASAQDSDGDVLQLDVTVYGVPPENCTKTTCGDATFSASGGGKTQVTAKIKFPLPGRYIVRARVSDGSGSIIWKDLVLTVYKKGEAAARAAKCCRHTPYITAHNLGRPIDRTYFRAKDSRKSALDILSWSSEYWNGADLEAERLFDYSILAPKMYRFPVETLTCGDVRVGGAGGTEVYGLVWAGEDLLGHGKSLTIVPESFETWATGNSDVDCAKHWSYNADNNISTTTNGCIVGCTTAMVENHIQTTGMVDQYTQALVSLSYGNLHVAPRVRVLPEIQVPKDPIIPLDTTYGYYDTPSHLAVEAAGGPRPWMTLTLANMAQHKIPKHRAWSSGLASGSATITKCFASMYYSVHETGHRLGFKHGQLINLPAGHAVPADPLSDPGTQLIPDDNYNQRLDIMSCCKSDYGLFHRTVAGWLKSSKNTEQDFKSNSNNTSIEPEDHRLNVRGLQVEYIRRNPNIGKQAWNDRAILDFNVVHGDYPHALPLGPGEISQQSQFSLLKEGRSWYDPSSRLLLSFERIAECDSKPDNLNTYNYTVTGFYGFNGEWPGKEAYTQHDYAGYAELPCAYVSITTAAEPPRGKLDVDIQLQEGFEKESTLGLVASQSSACIDSYPSNTSLENRSRDPGVAQLDEGLQATSPAGAGLLNIKLKYTDKMASIVWKDRWNQTLQAKSTEYFATSGSVSNGISLLPASLPVTAHVLASDGRHTRVQISLEKLYTRSATSTKSYLVVAKKKYYQLSEKIILDSPALIFGTVSECQTKVNAKRKQEKALKLWLLVTASVLAALLLGAGIIWLVKRWRQRKIAKQGNNEARRTTTPAALAETAKQCSSTPASFIVKISLVLLCFVN